MSDSYGMSVQNLRAMVHERDIEIERLQAKIRQLQGVLNICPEIDAALEAKEVHDV